MAAAYSPPGETIYALESESAIRESFDLQTVLRTPYRIDIMQPKYYVIDDFSQLFQISQLNLLKQADLAIDAGLLPPLLNLRNLLMLNEQKCEACSFDAIALTKEEQQSLLLQLSDWYLIERDDIPQLEKVYKFKNFKQAWAFSNKIAELAEEEFHHPSILLEWGKVTVTWWSHSIKGLHKNDFICASKCDALVLSE